MQPSAILLFASIGAIFVLLTLYVYILIYERRLFLGFWLIGWAIIALNYCIDAFFPDLLRQNRLVLLFSLSSYFFANILISWGIFSFLKIKAGKILFLSIGIIWLSLFLFFSNLNWPDLWMIEYTSSAVFVLTFCAGAAMIRSAKRYGKLVFFLGILNLAWVFNTVLFSMILKVPQLAPYVFSQMIMLVNAIGMFQLFLREQRREIERGLKYITYLSSHDELTGLHNKTFFDMKIKELTMNNDCLPISLIVGDMNGLKFINDIFGHQEGDSWLKSTALIFQQFCRQTDTLARWGGDEFAVILPKTDKDAAVKIGHQISAACESISQAEVLLSISLGVATKADCKTDLSEVLKEAEKLMYEAKVVEGKKARLAIIEAIVQLLQKKGYETKEHIERMENHAKALARNLNLSREKTRSLIQAVHIHDIGKIGIPDSVVLKKYQLDESEWSMMRKHAEIGYRIAHASGEFVHLADIVLYHHEWWNGQGYPHGLKEDAIPLLSRIVSILDAFDVMTHDQPYKPARSTKEALQELHLKAGTQFDPALVESFINITSSAD